MQNKEYREPTVIVINLQLQSQLLTGSPGNTGVTDYNWNSEVEE